MKVTLFNNDFEDSQGDRFYTKGVKIPVELPVTINFGHEVVGRFLLDVEKSEKNNTIEGSIVLDDKNSKVFDMKNFKGKLYCVPSFQIEEQEGTNIKKIAKFNSCSFTACPADTNLPPINFQDATD